MKRVITWFEISVEDFNRAKDFYSYVFDIEMEVEDVEGYLMGYFPNIEGQPSGAIVMGENCTPSDAGVRIYLDGGNIVKTLERVAEAGGEVVTPKTLINPEYGYYALFMDTEGNLLGLHSKE